jgi:hypothetical protein
MNKNLVIAFAAGLFVLLFIGTIIHHDPLMHESMAIADTQCCANLLSGMGALASRYTTIVFFAVTTFVLAISLPTASDINTRLYHPPKR